MFRAKTVFGILIVVSLHAVSSTCADVTLPPVISDNMLLQRDTNVRLWGKADPGEKVTAKLCNRSGSATAGKDGTWRIELEPLKAGGPFELTFTGKNKLVVKNVLVGEVWFCSGQSNMALSVWGCRNAREESAAADYPRIRLFTVPRKVADTPQTQAGGTWEVCTPKTVRMFSGVAYFFGREIHKELNVPVGLINSSWGGTVGQAWTPRDRLESHWTMRRYLTNWKKVLAAYPEGLKKHEAALTAWKEKVEKLGKDKAGREPPKPPGPGHRDTPGGLYNAMVAPFLPYAIRGAIWYQGEGNSGGEQGPFYRFLLAAIIQSWREGWKLGDFPFIFVQLPNYLAPQKIPVEGGWALIRESQLMTLALPNTAMAVTIDGDEPGNLHPRNKQFVGHRLALAGLGMVYGRDIVYSGPIYDSLTVEGTRLRIKFKHAGDGLGTKDNAPVKGFALAGKDKKAVWAEAKIDGHTVLVFSDKVPAPTAVYYGWGCNPPCNLYNSAMLPASPFRAAVPTPKKNK